MEQEKKVTLRNYAICFGIEVLIAFLVIWSKGFFTHSAAVNIQILSDAFFVAGILMTFYAGMIFVSGEGALIGFEFTLKRFMSFFIPMTKYESYANYRERKLSQIKKHNNSCVLVTGLVFLFIGIVFTVIWYAAFYNV